MSHVQALPASDFALRFQGPVGRLIRGLEGYRNSL